MGRWSLKFLDVGNNKVLVKVVGQKANEETGRMVSWESSSMRRPLSPSVFESTSGTLYRLGKFSPQNFPNYPLHPDVAKVLSTNGLPSNWPQFLPFLLDCHKEMTLSRRGTSANDYIPKAGMERHLIKTPRALFAKGSDNESPVSSPSKLNSRRPSLLSHEGSADMGSSLTSPQHINRRLYMDSEEAMAFTYSAAKPVEPPAVTLEQEAKVRDSKPAPSHAKRVGKRSEKELEPLEPLAPAPKKSKLAEVESHHSESEISAGFHAPLSSFSSQSIVRKPRLPRPSLDRPPSIKKAFDDSAHDHFNLGTEMNETVVAALFNEPDIAMPIIPSTLSAKIHLIRRAGSIQSRSPLPSFGLHPSTASPSKSTQSTAQSPTTRHFNASFVDSPQTLARNSERTSKLLATYDRLMRSPPPAAAASESETSPYKPQTRLLQRPPEEQSFSPPTAGQNLELVDANSTTISPSPMAQEDAKDTMEIQDPIISQDYSDESSEASLTSDIAPIESDVVPAPSTEYSPEIEANVVASPSKSLSEPIQSPEAILALDIATAQSEVVLAPIAEQPLVTALATVFPPSKSLTEHIQSPEAILALDIAPIESEVVLAPIAEQPLVTAPATVVSPSKSLTERIQSPEVAMALDIETVQTEVALAPIMDQLPLTELIAVESPLTSPPDPIQPLKSSPAPTIIELEPSALMDVDDQITGPHIDTPILETKLSEAQAPLAVVTPEEPLKRESRRKPPKPVVETVIAAPKAKASKATSAKQAKATSAKAGAAKSATAAKPTAKSSAKSTKSTASAAAQQAVAKSNASTEPQQANTAEPTVKKPSKDVWTPGQVAQLEAALAVSDPTSLKYLSDLVRKVPGKTVEQVKLRLAHSRDVKGDYGKRTEPKRVASVGSPLKIEDDMAKKKNRKKLEAALAEDMNSHRTDIFEEKPHALGPKLLGVIAPVPPPTAKAGTQGKAVELPKQNPNAKASFVPLHLDSSDDMSKDSEDADEFLKAKVDDIQMERYRQRKGTSKVISSGAAPSQAKKSTVDVAKGSKLIEYMIRGAKRAQEAQEEQDEIYEEGGIVVDYNHEE